MLQIGETESDLQPNVAEVKSEKTKEKITVTTSKCPEAHKTDKKVLVKRIDLHLEEELSVNYRDNFKNKNNILYCFKDNACPKSPNHIKSIIPEKYKTNRQNEINKTLVIISNNEETIC